MLKGAVSFGRGLGDMAAGMRRSVRSIPNAGRSAATSASQSPKARNFAASKVGQATSRMVTKSVDTSDTLVGRGLSSMNKHKVRTGMIVGSGMGVAAAMRTGPGTSKGNSSMYRY
jgi:hypothetical protein